MVAFFVNIDVREKRQWLQRSHYKVKSFILSSFFSSLFVSRENSNNLVSLWYVFIQAIKIITIVFLICFLECHLRSSPPSQARSSLRPWKYFVVKIEEKIVITVIKTSCKPKTHTNKDLVLPFANL